MAVEVDLILLLGTPLAVVEDHRGDRNVVAHCGHRLDHTHGPRAVTGVRDGWSIRSSGLGADDGRQGVTAVAPAHGGEEGTGLLEAQVTVGNRVDVADVSGHHDPGRHGLLQLA